MSEATPYVGGQDREFQQADHIRAYVGEANESIRNDAQCGRGRQKLQVSRPTWARQDIELSQGGNIGNVQQDGGAALRPIAQASRVTADG